METRTRIAAVSLLTAIPAALLGFGHAFYAHLSGAGLIPSFSPLHHPEALGLLVVGAVSAVSLFALSLAAWRWFKLEGEVGALRGAAVVETIGDETVHVVEAAGVQLFTAGLRSPAIFATRTALDVMTAPQMRAAVSHERSHLTNGDTRFRPVYSGISAALGWMPGIRGAVSTAIFLEERRADAAAIAGGATKADLVGAIIAVTGSRSATAASLGDSHVALRISFLASPGEDPAKSPTRAFGIATLVIATAPVVAHIPLICGL